MIKFRRRGVAPKSNRLSLRRANVHQHTPEPVLHGKTLIILALPSYEVFNEFPSRPRARIPKYTNKNHNHEFLLHIEKRHARALQNKRSGGVRGRTFNELSRQRRQT